MNKPQSVLLSPLEDHLLDVVLGDKTHTIRLRSMRIADELWLSGETEKLSEASRNKQKMIVATGDENALYFRLIVHQLLPESRTLLAKLMTDGNEDEDALMQGLLSLDAQALEPLLRIAISIRTNAYPEQWKKKMPKKLWKSFLLISIIILSFSCVFLVLAKMSLLLPLNSALLNFLA